MFSCGTLQQRVGRRPRIITQIGRPCTEVMRPGGAAERPPAANSWPGYRMSLRVLTILDSTEQYHEGDCHPCAGSGLERNMRSGPGTRTRPPETLRRSADGDP